MGRRKKKKKKCHSVNYVPHYVARRRRYEGAQRLVLWVRSDTKEKWNASAFPFFWLIFWQRTGQLSKTRNCVLAGSPFSFLSFSFSGSQNHINNKNTRNLDWDPRKEKEEKEKDFVDSQREHSREWRSGAHAVSESTK